MESKVNKRMLGHICRPVMTGDALPGCKPTNPKDPAPPSPGFPGGGSTPSGGASLHMPRLGPKPQDLQRFCHVLPAGGHAQNHQQLRVPSFKIRSNGCEKTQGKLGIAQPLPSPRRVGHHRRRGPGVGVRWRVSGRLPRLAGRQGEGRAEEGHKDGESKPRRHGEAMARAACGPRGPRHPAPSHVCRGSS